MYLLASLCQCRSRQPLLGAHAFLSRDLAGQHHAQSNLAHPFSSSAQCIRVRWVRWPHDGAVQLNSIYVWRSWVSSTLASLTRSLTVGFPKFDRRAPKPVSTSRRPQHRIKRRKRSDGSQSSGRSETDFRHGLLLRTHHTIINTNASVASLSWYVVELHAFCLQDPTPKRRLQRLNTRNL